MHSTLPSHHALATLFALILVFAQGCEQKPAKKQKSASENAQTTVIEGDAKATSAADEGSAKALPFGAKDLASLVLRAETAVIEGDADAYSALLAPETTIMEACGGAFPDKASRVKLGRSYMLMQKRVAPAIEKCSQDFDWRKASRIGAEGGVLFATPPGCKEGVKRYVDMHVYYQLEKDIYRLILKNPVTFDDGKTWVLDREPMCGRFILALTKESLAESVQNALQSKEQESLELLKVPDRILEGTCENPPPELISSLRSLSRQPARERSIRECNERVGWEQDRPDAPALDVTYGEPRPIPGCSDKVTTADITATSKNGATLTMRTLRYNGGIGERWHIYATPLCKKD